MQKLTFKRFIKKYVQELSLHHFTDVNKLLHEAETENPRLYEPLMFYALYSLPYDKFVQWIKQSDKLSQDYKLYFYKSGLIGIEDKDNLPNEYYDYQKVIKSHWYASQGKQESVNRIKYLKKVQKSSNAKKG